METNKDLVRHAYELFEAGRTAEFAELLAPDAVWTMPGRHELSQEYSGRDAIVNDFLPKLSSLTGGTYRAVPVDIGAGDKHIFVLQNSKGQREGKSIDYLICNVFTVKDGLIQAIRSYPFDAAAQEDFWQ